MFKFDSYDNVPLDFEGQCYIISDESEFWFKPNKIWHRENGPAYISDDGTKEWWFENNRHRLDGPAIVDPHYERSHDYFINGFAFKPEKFYNHPLVMAHKLNQILMMDNP